MEYFGDSDAETIEDTNIEQHFVLAEQFVPQNPHFRPPLLRDLCSQSPDHSTQLSTRTFGSGWNGGRRHSLRLRAKKNSSSQLASR